MNWLREPDAEPIPGYKLISPLGSGGFGEVWKCVAPGGIHKAIKFVFGNLNSLDGDSAKAEQEYKALERVKSDHVEPGPLAGLAKRRFLTGAALLFWCHAI